MEPARGLAFAEEDHRAFAFALRFVEVLLAVLELRDAQGDRLGAFARELLHLLQFLAQLLRVLDLRDDLRRDVLVAIEEVQQLLAHRVHQLGANLRVAELVLGLRLEHRVLQANRHRADHALAHVVALELALGVFVHRLEQAFAKRAQVRAAIAGVLAVDERIERLAVAAVAVRETELERLARVMQRRINRLRAVRLQILHHEIHAARGARLEASCPLKHAASGRCSGRCNGAAASR